VHRQHGDRISLFLFFKNKKIGLKLLIEENGEQWPKGTLRSNKKMKDNKEEKEEGENKQENWREYKKGRRRQKTRSGRGQ
jgi:hypothetical protein